jgi:hypothetical protein
MQIIKSDMQRSNFTNITFNNPENEQPYYQLMSDITGTFLQIEYLSVVEGTRDAHLMFIRPNELEGQR